MIAVFITEMVILFKHVIIIIIIIIITGESPSETWLNLSFRFSDFLRAAHIRCKTAIKPILKCLARKTTAL